MTSNNTFTNAGKREVLVQKTQASFPYLIKVYVGNEVYRYANYRENITYKGEVYTASFFQIQPPSKSVEHKTNTTIKFTNMDNFWTELVRTHSNDMTLEFVATIVYENNSIDYLDPIDYYKFKLGDANWSESTCQFDLVIDDKGDVLVPCDVADSLNTMGVV